MANDSLGFGRAHPVNMHSKARKMKEDKAFCMMIKYPAIWMTPAAVCVGRLSRASGLKERLQNQSSRHPVHSQGPLVEAHFRIPQEPVGF